MSEHSHAPSTRPVDISEAALLSHVLELAHMLGWRAAHFRAAMTKHGWRTPVAADGKGFPDLLLVRGKRLIVAELKSRTGRLTAEQQDWLDALADVADVYVWRPDDLEQIAEVLR